MEQFINPANECSARQTLSGAGACSTGRLTGKMAKFLQLRGVQPEECSKKIVEQMKQLLGVKGESCVLRNAEFRKFVGNDALIEQELDANFKDAGPKYTLDWFTNFNIDGFMQEAGAILTSHKSLNFAMIDFAKYGHPLATIDLAVEYTAKIRTISCIVNTDTNDGGGQHWMAVFIDMRAAPWTIEFFNSSGNSPQREIIQWQLEMERRAKTSPQCPGVAIVNCVGIQHQRGDTECGPYSVMYITKRLIGTPPRYFQSQRVPDDVATAFRASMFRECK